MSIDGYKVLSGVDVNGDGLLSNSEIYNIKYLCDTADGYHTLIDFSNEGPNVYCGTGGLQIDTGADLNNNNNLEFNEITETAHLCAPDSGHSRFINADIVDAGVLTFDDSVNGANVVSNGGNSYIMQTTDQNNPAGFFNGGGTGNKAILGITAFNNELLSSFSSLYFETNVPAGANNVYINLVVDLDGDISTTDDIKILVASDVDMADIITGNIGGYDTRSYDAIDSIWKAVNRVDVNACGNAGLGACPAVGYALNRHWGEARKNLDDINACCPNARIISANTRDGGMPRNVVTPGVMIISGDSGTHINLSFEVKNISIQ